MNQKIAVIAGVGPGLGETICRQFEANGYITIALSRHHKLNNSSSLISIHCDLTDDTSFLQAINKVQETYGLINVYVHNAHYLHIGSLLETRVQDFELCWNTVVRSAWMGIQAVLPTMLDEQSGTMLFTGATASIRGGANFPAFASAKFGLRGLAQSLAREYGEKGIHVAHIVLDGIIWGEQAHLRKMKKSDCLDPNDIAQQYIMLVNQSQSAWTHELDLRPSTEKF